MIDLVLAKSEKILVLAREFKDENDKFTVVSVYFNAGERKWDEYTSVVFSKPAAKMETVVSENGTLVLINSPSEQRAVAIELEFQKESLARGVATTFTFDFIGSFDQNLTISPDENSFTIKDIRYERTQYSHRWIRA